MNQFVYDAIDFLREFKFNGLDVDWEYPRGADDRAAYVNLLKELRLAFEGEYHILQPLKVFIPLLICR